MKKTIFLFKVRYIQTDIYVQVIFKLKKRFTIIGRKKKNGKKKFLFFIFFLACVGRVNGEGDEGEDIFFNILNRN